MNILKVFFGLILSTIALNTWAQSKPSVYTEDKTNIVVTRQQPQFTIELKSNPTTGYSWFLREYDANIITPVKHSYRAGDSGLMGAPGTEIWIFKVKPAGLLVPTQTTLRMFYSRPWEGPDSGTMAVFRVTTKP